MIAPACAWVMAPLRESCSRVGPSEARQYGSEAPLQGHLAEHLGRRAARGETARVIRASHQLTAAARRP